MKPIYILLVFVVSYTSLWSSSCSREDYDKAEYFSEQAAQKIVSKYGGGQDIRMELRSCSYNTHSEQFKTTINIYWNGKIFSSNHYNIDGILKFTSNGTLINFSKTYENSNVEDLNAWGNVITFANVLAEVAGNDISVTNNCSEEIQIKVHYKNRDGKWKTKGWWRFSPYETGTLKSGEYYLRTNNAVVYFYARTTEKGIRANTYDITIDGYKMEKVIDKQGTTEITVCN